ncbi:hypothetical protein EUGRSUZ_C02146 [Eucalyptus grandis]|uniref:Uncharacterized protein n=2 Tax=Eucalyptus grandis TaxID=71139 RepID=A0A059CQK1_EUCGR|nr:hypothetical protein EUGRSUZ_C02146 [Eucalyptus grandis]
MATARALKLLTLSSPSLLRPPQLSWVRGGSVPFRSPPLVSRSRCVGARFLSSSKGDASVEETTTTTTTTKKKMKKKKEKKEKGKGKVEGGNGGGGRRSFGLSSFADCTVGAAGHSSAIIQAHPELQCYLGMDVDPMAHQMAKNKIDSLLHDDSSSTSSNLRGYFLLRNFRFIKSMVDEVGDELMDSGFDGILMDLGVSSMQVNNAERGFSVLNDGPLDMRMDPQASLKAEDILNSWPESEVGRILREYGEESNWFSLQNKIVKSRLRGGLHSTGDLVSLIQNSTPRTKGRQGWIKTATRVFQALRIAVNDELKTLQDSLYSCFECLAPGGRLAVISFHSLEDRIVKQTFLDIVRGKRTDEDGEISEEMKSDLTSTITNDSDKEVWIRQIIQGERGRILTKRPITPSEKEEKLNRRSRSAKLRVIEKI